MTDAPQPFLDRRRLLGLLAGLSLAARVGEARAMRSAIAGPIFQDAAAILVAGPEGGMLDRWGRVLAPALAQSLPPETPLRRLTVGAPDGVTGANQFGARVAPDGQTVLLAPGDAAIAWLVGDPRAQYDVARWVSVMVAVAPAVVVARPGSVVPGRPLRLASAGPAGPDLPAVLGLDLLGVGLDLLPPLADDALQAAIGQGGVDAAFLRGHRVPDQARALAAAGARPVFTLGALDPQGRVMRCPAFPDVPTLAELYPTIRGQTLAGPLYAGWCAAAVASQLEFALVLPQLTPASMVALWRRAGDDAAGSLDIQALATANGLRALGGGEATATAGAAAADQPALLALRSWLSQRYNWKPA
ncbi:MAG: hypothetical protein P4L71_06100 [Acetobacteraceae bacterium]|nr:hypothetical protein [Acetobacteraceae bacterium]